MKQPIEEEEIGATHLLKERKAGEERTIGTLTSDAGEIVSSEEKKADLIFDYFSRLYKLEVNKSDELQKKNTRVPAQWLALPAINPLVISFMY